MIEARLKSVYLEAKGKIEDTSVTGTNEKHTFVTIVRSVSRCGTLSSSHAIVMPVVPNTFPYLPSRTLIQAPWSANILTAHDTLSDIYRHAYRILNQEDADPLQLTFHIETVSGDAIPLLEALARDPQGREMQDWLSYTAHLLGDLSVLLSAFRDNTQNRRVVYLF